MKISLLIIFAVFLYFVVLIDGFKNGFTLPKNRRRFIREKDPEWFWGLFTIYSLLFIITLIIILISFFEGKF